jgi:hypothetical protein
MTSRTPPEYVQAILKKFAETPHTEEAFYLAFNRLSSADLDTLYAWYGDQDWWRAFKRVCAHWGLCRLGRTAKAPPGPSQQPRGASKTVNCEAQQACSLTKVEMRLADPGDLVYLWVHGVPAEARR